MANFNGAEEAMGAAFKTPNNLLCPRCGQYGRVSFPVFVEDRNGHNVHAANSVVCVFCKEGEKKGRLITLFTGPVAKPDFCCRDVKLPAGCSFEGLRRALEKEPLRRWFHYAELGRNQLF
ncbi:hypothetical protein [Candidatus Avelusimicrobium fimicolum]|uniref:hypothetical protein n=1 Tax=Candidatus Avelusimicrobium fimicolum TaxID=3416216 RepID=UPI003D12C10E